ncbi:centrosomal protein 15 [Pelodytes ibericus]
MSHIIKVEAHQQQDRHGRLKVAASFLEDRSILYDSQTRLLGPHDALGTRARSPSRPRKIPSYLTREAELLKQHEAILIEKAKIQEEMKIQEDQHADARNILSLRADAAHSRNRSILQDLQMAEEKLKVMSRSSPHPTVITLEDRYWESIEEEIPKWEQFFLGKAHAPFGMMEKHLPKQKLKHSQTMQIPKVNELPPSGSNSRTFPR